MMPDFSKMMQMMGGGKGKSFESSEFEWTDDAKKRVERVPAGFMRNMTMQRVESYAKEQGVSSITLEVAEAGLSQSKAMMGSMMGGGYDDSPTDPNAPDEEKSPTPSSHAPQADAVSDEVPFFVCEMCGYSIKGFAPDECPICLAAKEKFKQVSASNSEGVVTSTSGLVMRWSDDAKERLAKTPEGFMRDMTQWRIEQWARTHGQKEITLELVEEKYQYWNENSQDMQTDLPWDDEAIERVQRIPEFVRPMVQKEVERHAKEGGKERVTAEILAEVRNRWETGEEFHA